MRLFLTLLLLAAGSAAFQTHASAAEDAAFEEVDESVALLSRITGLAALKKVQHDTITRPEVKAFLEERIKEEIDPEEIRVDELALKRLGLVPRDFDLKKTTIDLITEQAAAFYDYRKKRLFILEGEDIKLPEGTGAFSREAQRMILVHELAHALADQHFDLGKFIRRGRNDDASTARLAVMEGQATWLMLETMAHKLGQSVREAPQMMDVIGSGMSQTMMAQYPVLAQAPLYLRASLIFPYNQGLKFQHAIVQKLGNAAFAKVFRDPPLTTQQVLHPETYLAGVKPARVALPALARPRAWKTLTEGTVGEFDHAVLLEQYLSKEAAGEIAPHWRGGTFRLARAKSGQQVALLYASEWSDAASARRMFEAWKQVMKGKWKKFEIASEMKTSMTGTSEDGFFRLQLDGNRVTATEGLKSRDELGSRLN